MPSNTIRGSQTERNLLFSFAAESQARNRYTYFASQAKREGLIQISAIFAETADQEKEHAKRFFKFLEGEKLIISGEFPAGVIGTTAANLAAAAEGEYDEWHRLYPGFAEIARAENYNVIADVFEAVRISEEYHEKRYRSLLANLENGLVFKRPESVAWRCRNCGYIHFGKEAPASCPACSHPQGHFEISAENW